MVRRGTKDGRRGPFGLGPLRQYERKGEQEEYSAFPVSPRSPPDPEAESPREGGSDARRPGSRDRKPARGDPRRDGEGGWLLPQADRADDGAPRGRRRDRLPARGRHRERGARAEDGGDAPASGGIRPVGLFDRKST